MGDQTAVHGQTVAVHITAVAICITTGDQTAVHGKLYTAGAVKITAVTQGAAVTNGGIVQVADRSAGQVHIAAPSVITADDTGNAVRNHCIPYGHIGITGIEVAALPLGSTAADQCIGDLHIHIDRGLGIGGSGAVSINVAAVIAGGTGIVTGAVFHHTAGDGQCTGVVHIDTGTVGSITAVNVTAGNGAGGGERNTVFEEYAELNRGKRQLLQGLDDLERFQKQAEARWKKGTRSKYTARRIPSELSGKSNGESAFSYFTQKIVERALYLLDEPENSLSATLQKELARFIEDSARFYKCQFVISTHSPFLLAMKDAVIYDLDCVPVTVRPWTELANVRAYYDFFKEHAEEF